MTSHTIIIATAEIISAVFVFMLSFGQVGADKSVSIRRLRLLSVFTIVWLFADAFSYILGEPSVNPLGNHWLIHLINLLTYVMGNVVIMTFTYFCEAYLGERIKLKKWAYLVPLAIMTVNIVVEVVYYLQGKLVVYQDGYYVIVGEVPQIVWFSFFALLIYVPVLAFVKRKQIGVKMLTLMVSYAIPIVASYFISVATGFDCSVFFGSVSLFIIAEILQTDMTNRKFNDAEAAKKLIDSVASSYNVAYVVNMADDSFKQLRMDDFIIGKDESFDSFTEAKEFFFKILPPLDQKRMRHELDYDVIRQKVAKTKTYKVEYRAFINGATIWHEMQVTYIDGDDVAIGFAVRDLEATKLHIEEKRFKDFFALYEVDIDTETIKVVIDSPFYPLAESGTAFPYTLATQKFAETLEGEAREFFEQLSDVSYVKKMLIDEDKHTYTYRSKNVGNSNWVDVTSYVTLRNDDGTPAMFSMGFSMIDSYGAARQELQSQIAEQKELLEKKQVELQDALYEAQAANRAKTEFLCNMSHDVRTPMNAILGFTNIIKNHYDDKDRVVDSIEKIQESGNLLLALINSVLDVSRIESGNAESEEQAGDVYYSFAGIETTLKAAAAVKDIDLTFGYGDITDRYVYADFTRCLRIFTNLISNSIKYTREGGWVKVFCEQTGPAENGYVSYKYIIEDNGMGMSEEFQRHMFETFAREHNTTVSGIQGTGVGLYVCKAFVDFLGGTITCDSKVGEGTKFTVILPFKIQEGKQYTDPITGNKLNANEEKVMQTVDFRGKRVLVVEDNEMNREIAEEILEDAGLEVECAGDGSVAVEYLRDKGALYYDFILMDIQMPKMNGYEATREIRAMYPDYRIPIISVSANAFEEDRKASFEAGMDAHVAKPINVSELFTVLADHIMR